jgi:hypothetical protein
MAIPTANLSKITFSSAFRYENVHMKGSVTADVPNTAFTIGTAVITHNLGYIPFYRVYIQFPGDSKIYAGSTGPTTFGLVSDYEVDTINADTTSLRVGLSKGTVGGGTFTVYFRIYKEQR